MSLQVKSDSLTSAASYLANGSVFIWGALTLNQLLAIIGVVLALATFGVNFYFQRRRDHRDTEFHDKRMQVKEDTAKFVKRLPDTDE